MMTTLDRRHGERARIPCNIPVELMDDSHQALPFEADAVDLSVGGLSLRAPMLPEIGSHLRCSFEAMPGGAQVLGRGEVVWTQPSDASGGEFGLRFVELDPKAQALIDEMVAERIARIETPFAGSESVIANLEIENVDAPIAARLVYTSDTEALFEQPLDLLMIGRAVTAHAGVSLVRGHLARVAVRMDGSTPMLALTLQIAQDKPRFGEFDWDGLSPDTEPDLLAPSSMFHDEQASLSVAAEPGQGAMARDAGLGRMRREDQLSLVFKHGEPEHAQPAASQSEEDLQLALSGDPDELEQISAEQPLMAAEHEARVSLHYRTSEPDAWVHAPEEETTWLVRVLRVFAGVLAFVQHWTAPLGRLSSRLVGARQRIVQGAGRIVTRARPRRTTTAANSRDSFDSRGTLRLLGLGLMSVAAVALFAYTLTPTVNDDIPLHRGVVPDVMDEVQPGAAAQASPTTVATANASAQPATEGAASKPTSAKPQAGVMTFGQAQVPNARRFVLHMKSPISSIQGTADGNGFSVVIAGSRAATKAAPIKEGNPNVARAMIVNQGDGSQLSVRFASGKNPAYRVSALGSTLEVLIGM